VSCLDGLRDHHHRGADGRRLARAWLDPAFAPGPLLLAGQLVATRHALVEREHADFAGLKRGLIGVPLGVVGAMLVLSLLSKRLLAITIGSLTALAATMLLLGWQLSRTPRAEFAAGVVCAFSALTAALPGPPLVCVYSDMKPQTMRPTASMLILSVAGIGLVSLIATGNFGAYELELLLLLMPGVVIVTWRDS